MDLGNVASLPYFAPELMLVGAILVLVLLDLGVKRKALLGDGLGPLADLVLEHREDSQLATMSPSRFGNV